MENLDLDESLGYSDMGSDETSTSHTAIQKGISWSAMAMSPTILMKMEVKPRTPRRRADNLLSEFQWRCS
jgi:hypothetical protein